jgi:hypothetical protein
VAELVEQMMGSSEPHYSAGNHRAKTMREARTCYDHLAGSVAVEIYEFMQADGWLEPDGSSLTPRGREQFLRGDLSATNPAVRPAAPVWTGVNGGFIWGEAGAALAHSSRKQRMDPARGGFREVVVTASGRVAIVRHFTG